MRKIKSLRANRVTVNGRTLAKGETIECPDDRARELVERGVAEYADKEPEPTPVMRNLTTPVPKDVPDPDPNAAGVEPIPVRVVEPDSQSTRTAKHAEATDADPKATEIVGPDEHSSEPHAHPVRPRRVETHDATEKATKKG